VIALLVLAVTVPNFWVGFVVGVFATVAVLAVVARFQK
jgi:hypothetical protein